jgi:hypothetical protein
MISMVFNMAFVPRALCCFLIRHIRDGNYCLINGYEAIDCSYNGLKPGARQAVGIAMRIGSAPATS